MDHEKQKKLLNIAATITDGDIANANLTCPFCETGLLIFSFVKGQPPHYGLFIVCPTCGHQTHFNLTEQPKNYRDDRVLPAYQAQEDQAIEFAKKKRQA